MNIVSLADVAVAHRAVVLLTPETTQLGAISGGSRSGARARSKRSLASAAGTETVGVIGKLDVWRQMIKATPWGQQPSYLIHDRDRVYGADFAIRLAGLAVESLRTPIQAPRANAIAERVVRSLRRECLDHILPLSGGHLRSVLAEFVSYYNWDRPRRSLGLEPPVPSPLRSVDGEVVFRPVLNGLHHVYERVA